MGNEWDRRQSKRGKVSVSRSGVEVHSQITLRPRREEITTLRGYQYKAIYNAIHIMLKRSSRWNTRGGA